MGTTGSSGRSNFRWAALFFGVVLALWFVVLPVLDRLSSDVGHNRPVLAMTCLVIVLAPFALVWLVAEAHLRWSPRDRVARGVVGWLLALGTLAAILIASPVAIHIVIVSILLDG